MSIYDMNTNAVYEMVSRHLDQRLIEAGAYASREDALDGAAKILNRAEHISVDAGAAGVLLAIRDGWLTQQEAIRHHLLGA